MCFFPKLDLQRFDYAAAVHKYMYLFVINGFHENLHAFFSNSRDLSGYHTFGDDTPVTSCQPNKPLDAKLLDSFSIHCQKTEPRSSSMSKRVGERGKGFILHHLIHRSKVPSCTKNRKKVTLPYIPLQRECEEKRAQQMSFSEHNASDDDCKMEKDYQDRKNSLLLIDNTRVLSKQAMKSIEDDLRKATHGKAVEDMLNSHQVQIGGKSNLFDLYQKLIEDEQAESDETSVFEEEDKRLLVTLESGAAFESYSNLHHSKSLGSTLSDISLLESSSDSSKYKDNFLLQMRPKIKPVQRARNYKCVSIFNPESAAAAQSREMSRKSTLRGPSMMMSRKSTFRGLPDQGNIRNPVKKMSLFFSIDNDPSQDHEFLSRVRKEVESGCIRSRTSTFKRKSMKPRRGRGMSFKSPLSSGNKKRQSTKQSAMSWGKSLSSPPKRKTIRMSKLTIKKQSKVEKRSSNTSDDASLQNVML